LPIDIQQINNQAVEVDISDNKSSFHYKEEFSYANMAKELSSQKFSGIFIINF